MNNNQTIILDHENNLSSSVSSNKTILLSDDVVYSTEIFSSNKQTNQIKAAGYIHRSHSDKAFSHYFEINQTNKLLGYAIPLISFVNRFRTIKNEDQTIFKKVIDLVNEYVQKLKEDQVSTEILQSASFILCMTIDEIALKSPLHYHSSWLNNGVLDTFFKQSQDDGYFLNLIEHYLKNQNKDILELIAVCLSIGSRGNNATQTAIKFENLRFKLLNALQGAYYFEHKHFSSHAVPTDQKKITTKRLIPLWLIILISTLILLGIYSAFWIALFFTSEPTYNRLIKLDHPAEVTNTKGMTQ